MKPFMVPHNMFFRGVVGIMAIAACGACLVAAGGEPSATLRTVTEAWRRRAEKFHSARFVLRTQRTDVNENVLDLDESASDNAQVEAEVIAGVFEYTLTTKISIDGIRMHHELQGERPMGSRLGRADRSSAYNGEVSKSFTDSNARFKYPTGHIYKMEQCEATSVFYTHPLRWTYALFEQAVSGINLDKLTLSTRQGVIDDQECLILEQKSEFTFGGDEAFWIDPSKDYSIVRYTVGTGDQVAAQIDCTYQFDPEHGWAPSRWTTWRFRGDGTPRTTGKVEVVEYEINPEFSSDEFEITFPVGTLVSDQRPQKGIGRTGTFDYIVLEGGKKRQITWDERHASYDELVATESGTAGRVPEVPRVNGGSTRYWWVVGALLLGIVALLVFRNRQKHSN